jgi:hypothetical protein
MARRRPGWVTFVGVLLFIEAGFAAIAGIVFLTGRRDLAARLLGEQAIADLESKGVLHEALSAAGVVTLVICAVVVLLGVKVLQGRNWARITVIVFSALSALNGLVSVLRQGGRSLIGVLLAAMVIVALTLPVSRAFFQPPPATPPGAPGSPPTPPGWPPA